MSLLLADDLSLAFGKKVIFDETTVAVEHGDRLGIVGPNGAGKSTLLRILAGQTIPDGGKVVRARGVRVGYLPQEHGDVGQGTLLESLLATAPGRDTLEARLADVEAGLAAATDPEAQLELSAELADLVSLLSALERDFAAHRAKRILVGLGFTESDFGRPTREFSGGWRMRAALASLLFQKPDVMLLDEPTNHLDMPSVHWLSSFLSSIKQAVVLTCHDREFLNRHVNRVASLELEGLRLFRGNYDEYLEQRDLELQYLEARVKKDEQRKKELEAFVERFRAKASKARQAQSKARMIEKMQEDWVDLPQLRRAISIRFPPTTRPSDVVVKVEGLSFGYERPLFQQQNLELRRGDRVAIVGVNGAGKTTLLKLIAGELKPWSGNIQFGRGVQPSYFAQHHAETLNLNNTVLEEVWNFASTLSQTQVRSILGAFLFSGDDVEKSVAVLSGGEKARVALARLLALPGNLLLLDEPTNHLDTDSADKLTESLLSYDGTMLFVSHNLDFARRLSNVVWDVQSGKVVRYPGSLADYMEHLAALEAETEAQYSDTKVVSASKAQRMETRQQTKAQDAEKKKKLTAYKKRSEALEAEIQSLEAEQAALEVSMADPSTHADADRSKKITQRYAEVRDRLDAAMNEWTQVEADKEAMER